MEKKSLNQLISLFSLLLLSYPSRYALSAVNMEQTDYDSRTALHIAAAEGDTSLLVNTFFSSLCFDIQKRIHEI